MNEDTKAVLAYIRKNFDLEWFRMSRFPAMPARIRLQDKAGDECVVLYDFLDEDVKVIFPDAQSEK